MTSEAVALIKNSLELAGADPTEVGVRLRVAGGQVRPQFVTGPRTGDEVVEVDGLRVFVAAEIVAGRDHVEVAVSPEHSTLVIL